MDLPLAVMDLSLAVMDLPHKDTEQAEQEAEGEDGWSEDDQNTILGKTSSLLSIYLFKILLLGQILLAVREFENTHCLLQQSPQNCSPCQANAGLSKAVNPWSISMSIRCDLILSELPPVQEAPPLSFALRSPSNKTRARAGL